jgi:hypothetical protein
MKDSILNLCRWNPWSSSWWPCEQCFKAALQLKYYVSSKVCSIWNTVFFSSLHSFTLKIDVRDCASKWLLWSFSLQFCSYLLLPTMGFLETRLYVIRGAHEGETCKFLEFFLKLCYIYIIESLLSSHLLLFIPTSSKPNYLPHSMSILCILK